MTTSGNGTPRQCRTGLRGRLTGSALAASLALAAPTLASAQSGWKWLGSREPAPVAAPRPTNGFAAGVQRLMDQSRQQAQAGNFEEALALAERAHKIADAASSVLGEDPQCSPKVTAKFMRDMAALKDTMAADAVAEQRSVTRPAVAVRNPAPQTPAASPATATVAVTQDPPKVDRRAIKAASTINRAHGQQLAETAPAPQPITKRPAVARSHQTIRPVAAPEFRALPESQVAGEWPVAVAAGYWPSEQMIPVEMAPTDVLFAATESLPQPQVAATSARSLNAITPVENVREAAMTRPATQEPQSAWMEVSQFAIIGEDDAEPTEPTTVATAAPFPAEAIAASPAIAHAEPSTSGFEESFREWSAKSRGGPSYDSLNAFMLPETIQLADEADEYADFETSTEEVVAQIPQDSPAPEATPREEFTPIEVDLGLASFAVIGGDPVVMPQAVPEPLEQAREVATVATTVEHAPAPEVITDAAMSSPTQFAADTEPTFEADRVTTLEFVEIAPAAPKVRPVTTRFTHAATAHQVAAPPAALPQAQASDIHEQRPAKAPQPAPLTDVPADIDTFAPTEWSSKDEQPKTSTTRRRGDFDSAWGAVPASAPADTPQTPVETPRSVEKKSASEERAAVGLLWDDPGVVLASAVSVLPRIERPAVLIGTASELLADDNVPADAAVAVAIAAKAQLLSDCASTAGPAAWLRELPTSAAEPRAATPVQAELWLVAEVSRLLTLPSQVAALLLASGGLLLVGGGTLMFRTTRRRDV